MMTKSYLKYTCVALLALLFAACDSYMDDNWQPGEQVAESVTGAYFSTDNETGFSVSEDSLFRIVVSRVDSTKAVTVPINVVHSDTTAIEFPATVSFEAGKDTASLVCKAKDLTEDVRYSFTLAIDSTQVNPYAAGSSTFTATVINGSLWRDVIVDAPTYFYYNGSMTYNFSYKTTIKQYLTTNEFYVDNLLNSGSGFYFKIKNADGTYNATIEDISTIDGTPEAIEDMGCSVTDYGTFSYNYYYTYDAEGTATYVWTDETNGITWDYYLWYGGSDYSEFLGTKGYMYLTSWCSITSGAKSAYSTLFIDWRN